MYKFLGIALFLTIFLFSGCAHASNNFSLTLLDKPLTVIKTTDSEGVILPIQLGRQVLHQCSRPTPEKIESFWEPTESQIRKLESLLPKYVAENPPQLAPDLVKRLSKYKRQYIGVVQNGRKIIYVNFFVWDYYSDDNLRWQKQAVIVCDGGASFWGIEFDMESETFSNLFTNGVA